MRYQIKNIFLYISLLLLDNINSQTTFFKSFGGNMSDYGEEIISTIDSGFLAIGATESLGMD